MNIELIASLQNPKIKHLVRLKDRRARDETGLFLIEGFRELSRALLGDFPLQALFFCPELFLGSSEHELIKKALAKGAKLFQVAPPVFEKISYRDRPDGLLALAAQWHKDLSALPLTANPLILIAEAIEKPGNLGTMLRSSDAVHADAVIVCDRCTDIFNPNVVRASVGTLFTIPVLEEKSEPVLRFLKERNIQIVAATPHAEQVYTEADLSGPVAIVVGTEQIGLSEYWMSQADIQVSIPMLGIADSLNVATAATLLLYEALRQRKP